MKEKGPLSDILVLSLEQAVAAPYCSRLFAESGARVIKVERTEGDFARHYDTVIHGQSSHFVWLNSGKESIVLDLSVDRDSRLFRTILKKADVFIQNLKPGAVERLGFCYETVRDINPQLVMCSISGYGATGRYANMKAYDALIQAETGLCSITGSPDKPAKVGASIVDISTGLTAQAEILKALLTKSRTGLGQHVEVSMFGVMAEWMAVPLAYYEYGDKILKGTGLDHGQIAPYGAFRVEDGEVFIVVQNHREWEQLCKVALQRADLVKDKLYDTNESRVANKDALRAEIELALRGLSRTEALDRLLKADIACGNINDVSDLSTHPALTRKTVTSSSHEINFVQRLGNCLDNAVVPELNQHGESIRQEFND